jgi:hypothetical protein
MPFHLPQLAAYTATCAVPECENAGQPCTVTAAAVDPFVICGGCGARIRDVAPVPALEQG